MRGVANYCDYFVICSGSSSRQVQGITDEIEEGLARHHLSVPFMQGYGEGRWVVLDAGDVVAHVFDARVREFYELDYLWREARTVSRGKDD